MPEHTKNPGNPALMDEFKRWLQKHGGTGVFVKTKQSDNIFRQTDDDGELLYPYIGSGRVFLAAGEVAPFMTTTINQFVESGAATRTGNRVTLNVL